MTAETILLADDDQGIRTVVSQALGRAGFSVRSTGNAATLWRWVADGEGDLVITDVILPDENGLDLVPRIRKHRPDLRIVVMSAHNTLMTAVKANERGAFEYLPKPFDIGELVSVVQRGLTESRESAAGGTLETDTGDEELPLIGRSPAMQDIYRVLARLMGTDLSVIITGESGTGKELVARALHQYGKRRNGPFIAINMAAIPKELIESELFGHEKGAFTGATARYAGRFEQADGGTLFLDEIGDMPLEAQTRLLRVLQQGEYLPVGGRTPLKADVRIVAATHRDLSSMVRQGLFREDLYYRLNVVPLRLPPLRERSEDIPDLVRHFLRQAQEEGLPEKSLDNAAMQRMMAYRWPGNVRELENLIRRLAALYAEDVIGVDVIELELSDPAPEMPGGTIAQDESIGDSIERHLSAYFEAHGEALPPPGLYERVLREVERPLISLTLGATRGNQLKAAALLGLNRNTLRKKNSRIGHPGRQGRKLGRASGRGADGIPAGRHRKDLMAEIGVDLSSARSRIFWRLIAWARRHGIARRLAVGLTIAALVSGVATYVALTGSPPFTSRSTLLILIIIDLVLLLPLTALTGTYLVRLWSERRRRSAGSKLQARLVLLFSVIAIVPAIIIVVFTALFFNFGIQSWFSERVGTALSESLSITDKYLTEKATGDRGEGQERQLRYQPLHPVGDDQSASVQAFRHQAARGPRNPGRGSFRWPRPGIAGHRHRRAVFLRAAEAHPGRPGFPGPAGRGDHLDGGQHKSQGDYAPSGVLRCAAVPLCGDVDRAGARKPHQPLAHGGGAVSQPEGTPLDAGDRLFPAVRHRRAVAAVCRDLAGPAVCRPPCAPNHQPDQCRRPGRWRRLPGAGARGRCE